MSLMKTNMARMPSFRAASIPLKEPIIRSNGRDLTMQGSTGAPKYELRFASTQAGPFTLLKNFVDNQDTGKPFATVSQSGWYQVRAIKGGKNSTSNIVQLI